ncbi:MAG: hypothetical protein OER86_07550 [Phycisphaerae bacterium]|nr:hypothetical protein [Phycisphaerae bacterium]
MRSFFGHAADYAAYRRSYENLPFPFAQIASSRFELKQSWSLAQMLGYLGTWSAVKRYEQALGVNPVAAMKVDLARAWGDAGQTRAACWLLPPRIGRVE